MNKKLPHLLRKVILIALGFIFISTILLFNYYNKKGYTFKIDTSNPNKNETCRKEQGYFFDYFVCSESELQ